LTLIEVQCRKFANEKTKFMDGGRWRHWAGFFRRRCASTKRVKKKQTIFSAGLAPIAKAATAKSLLEKYNAFDRA